MNKTTLDWAKEPTVQPLSAEWKADLLKHYQEMEKVKEEILEFKDPSHAAECMKEWRLICQLVADILALENDLHFEAFVNQHTFHPRWNSNGYKLKLEASQDDQHRHVNLTCDTNPVEWLPYPLAPLVGEKVFIWKGGTVKDKEIRHDPDRYTQFIVDVAYPALDMIYQRSIDVSKRLLAKACLETSRK